MVARYKKNLIDLGKQSITVYASPRISSALHEITKDMTFYDGVRLAQILAAMYEQGKKDGARNAFDTLRSKVSEAHKLVPHRNPGKPKKNK